MGTKFTDENMELLVNQGISQAEIARKVGVSEQAVSSREKRLKAKLAERFLEEADPDPVSLKEKLTHRSSRIFSLILRFGSNSFGNVKVMEVLSASNLQFSSVRKISRCTLPQILTIHALPCFATPCFIVSRNLDLSLSLIRAFFTGESLRNAPTKARMNLSFMLWGFAKI